MVDFKGALNNLVNQLSGGQDVGKTLETKFGQIKDQIETAIGDKLSGAGSDKESAKTLEEKANAALEDLLDKLGLNGDDNEISKGLDGDNKLKTPKKEEKAPIYDKLPKYDKKPIEEIDDTDYFSPDEAKTYAEGEKEVQERVAAAIENNPDMDPAEVEAQVREAYALENPEYAKEAEEAQKVLEEHDTAMEEAYAKYQEENPAPNKEDFDNPLEYVDAMEKWTNKAKAHMEEQEAKYREDNKSYDNLKDAVDEANSGIHELRKPDIINIKPKIDGPLIPNEKTPKETEKPKLTDLIPPDVIGGPFVPDDLPEFTIPKLEDILPDIKLLTKPIYDVSKDIIASIKKDDLT